MDYFTNIITRATAAPVLERSSYSIGDPALAEFLGIGRTSAAGVDVNESSSLSLTAVYASVRLISGTVAGLPLKSYRTLGDGSRERVSTWLDNPGGAVGLTPYEFKELAMVHLLLHGNFYGLHVYNGAGTLAGLNPIHPLAVTVESADNTAANKVFTITLADGTRRAFTNTDMTHIPGLSTDGLVGVSPIRAMRDTIGTGIAGNDAAARIYKNGLLIAGLVTSEDTIPEDEAKSITASLKGRLSGTENAGDIAFINRNLKFTPWTMNAEDAQFLESRSFQVEEIARLYGVPKEMLSASGATSWGTGISELVRAFQKFTLAPYTTRIEERLSALLASPRHCEFDYDGLLQPTPSEVTDNLVKEIGAGLLTVDEARRILNRPPLTTPQEVTQ